MRYIYTFFLLTMTLAGLAQNPVIIKTVSGTNLEPESDALINSRVKPWNGKIFYQGKGSSTQCILAVTDGTAAGTIAVKDLGDIGGINGIFPAQDFVYIATLKSEFVSFSPITINWIRQLWKTDGTSAGTVLLKAFDVTTSSGNTGIFTSDALSSVNYSISGNTMFFNGYEAASGPELWKSDGTPGGTARVKDIIPGTTGGNPYAFCKVGNKVCFFARESGFNYQLWQTDGTESGTQILTVINPAGSLAEFNCGLYKGKMYFWANDGVTGAEVWYTDGTAAGTQLLKDIVPGNNAFTGSGGFRTDLNFIRDDNYLYFPIERSKYVWRTDGTPQGTIQLSGLMTSQNIAGAIAKGNTLYWQDNVSTLYKTNGTPASTALIRNDLTQAVQLYSYKGAAWFAARATNNSDVEPWRSDGTAANTTRALDIYPGGFGSILSSSNPFGYFELNGYLYFFATNAAGKHLLRYNGDMTFNGSIAGGRWRDSANWNSFMPPGITDTAYIGSGLTVNVNGANAYAGTLVMQAGSSVNLNAVTDSLFVHKRLQGTSATGNGILVMKNFNGDTVQVDNSFTGNNINVQGIVAINNAVTVSNQLNLTNNARLLTNNHDVVLSGSTSSISGDANNYVVTNGTGSLQIQNIGAGGRTGSVTFPVGTTSFYNPAIIENAGTLDAFRVRVQPGISNIYAGETPSGGSYTGGAVNATWYLNEGIPGGSNATVTLQWNAAQELPSFDRGQSRLGHYTGGAWQLSVAGAANGANPYTFSQSGQTNFSPFGVLNSNATLPIHQLTLSVSKLSGVNKCSWIVRGDDIASLLLEKSANGRDFFTAQTLPIQFSGIADEAAMVAGKIFYRLKATDKYGNLRYSNVVWIDNNNQNAIVLYPTLFSNSVFVQNSGGHKAFIDLFSADGKLMLQQRLQEGTNSINTSLLKAGVYFYQVTTDSKLLQSGQLEKR